MREIICLLLLLGILYLLWSVVRERPPFRKVAVSILLLRAALVAIFAIVAGYHMVTLPGEMDVPFTLACELFVLFQLLLVWLKHRIRRDYENYLDAQLQLQKDRDLAEYYHERQVQDEEQKILIHDIKNHLRTMEQLNSENRREELSDYVSQLLDSPAYQTTADICDNKDLNAILSRYLRLARERGIDFQVDVRSRMLTRLSYVELTMLFCNLLDNAFEEAGRKVDAQNNTDTLNDTDNPNDMDIPSSMGPSNAMDSTDNLESLETDNASKPQVTLSISPETGTVYTVIVISNSCTENPYRKDGTLSTRKAEPYRHGYGLKSARKVVEQYQGTMEMEYKEDRKKFYTIIALNAGR